MKTVTLELTVLEFTTLKLTMDSIYGNRKIESTEAFVEMRMLAPNVLKTMHEKFMSAIQTVSDDDLKQAMEEYNNEEDSSL